MQQVRLLILVLFLTGCSTSKYYLTTDPEMINSYQTKNVHDGYLLTPPETYHVQNKVILIPKDVALNEVINNTILLLQNKKYSQVEKYLETVDSNNSYLSFAYGLLYLYRNNYSRAITELKKSELLEIQYIVDLLIVDCEYEIVLSSNYDLNYYNFQIKYQNVIDNYELTDTYREIINRRINFIRYKM